MITADYVRSLLDYDADDGSFHWRVSRGRVAAGQSAGGIVKGYLVIRIDGRNYAGHRLAWLHVHGEWPKGFIDHINRNPSDNRIANLRPCTHRENQQNLENPRSHNRSGYLGVSPKRGRWLAQIRTDGRVRSLGTFATPEEAHAAYLDAKGVDHPFWSGAA